MTSRLDPDDPAVRFVMRQFMSSLSDLRYTGEAVPKEPLPEPEVCFRPGPPSVRPDGTVVLVDIRSSGITLLQSAKLMDAYRSDPAYEGFDIVLDGDLYAIVARPKGDAGEGMV